MKESAGFEKEIVLAKSMFGILKQFSILEWPRFEKEIVSPFWDWNNFSELETIFLVWKLDPEAFEKKIVCCWRMKQFFCFGSWIQFRSDPKVCYFSKFP